MSKNLRIEVREGRLELVLARNALYSGSREMNLLTSHGGFKMNELVGIFAQNSMVLLNHDDIRMTILYLQQILDNNGRGFSNEALATKAQEISDSAAEVDTLLKELELELG